MKTRNEKSPTHEGAAKPTKRARLEALLFDGGKSGPSFQDPKLPPFHGD